MTLFSQRHGIRPIEKALQREKIDSELRNRLWSALQICIWDHWSFADYFGTQPEKARMVETVVKRLWLNYFKEAIDTIPDFNDDHPRSAYEIIREHFFEGEWWQAYDLLEFLYKAAPEPWKQHLKQLANKFLEQENAAYRFVDSEIVEITSQQEVKEVELALSDSPEHINSHFVRALELLSDRQHPDYRNSIKESIAAVEAACQRVAGDSKAALGHCLKKIKSHGYMHPAFEQSLMKLYGYTSDSGGIRHALTEQDENPSYADAKFMLVVCSAFVNFLWARASELEINFKK